jgi:hypothetical protein
LIPKSWKTVTLASDLTADITGIFLTDFAVVVNATTWGNAALGAIFDREAVDFDDVSRSTPFLLLETAEIPTTADTGDLFIVEGTTYKLVNIQYAEPGMSRVILAAT